jgi:hypothetical protein
MIPQKATSMWHDRVSISSGQWRVKKSTEEWRTDERAEREAKLDPCVVKYPLNLLPTYCRRLALFSPLVGPWPKDQMHDPFSGLMANSLVNALDRVGPLYGSSGNGSHLGPGTESY